MAILVKPVVGPKSPSKLPSSTYRLEVRLKSDYPDAEGLSALCLLQGLGLSSVREVRASQVYEIRGPWSASHLQQAARELLSDCVTQEHRLLSPSQAVSNGMRHWRVEVWLKDTVTDPVAETVRQALIELGLPAPESVRVAAAYRITGHCGRHQLERAVPRCLANPVIHRFLVMEAAP